MKKHYALGLQQIQQELNTLQNPGFYWITSQRQDDARTLLRQVVSQQKAATLISADEKPQALDARSHRRSSAYAVIFTAG